jgi:hypothetical protein
MLNLEVHKITASLLKALRNWETATLMVLRAIFLTIQAFWGVRAR